MAEFYREEVNRYVTSFPKKKTTRYIALGEREALPDDKLYVGRHRRSELEEDGYTASYRPLATVSVTESEPWEVEYGQFEPKSSSKSEDLEPEERDKLGWWNRDNKFFFPTDSETGQLSIYSQAMPAVTEVGALVSDPSMRAAVPTMLAMAVQGKQNVTHESRISQHSSRLINEVKDSVGITSPEANPNSEPRYTSDNNLPMVGTYVEGHGKTYGVGLLHDSYGDKELERVPDSEVKVARGTVRGFLRNRKLSPQFDAHVGEQMQFEGMD